MAKWVRANMLFTTAEREAFWRLLSPLVEKLDGRISMEQLEECNRLPEHDIWFCLDEEGGFRSVMVTRVRQYTAGLRVLLLSHAAGELEDFGPESLEKVESIARYYECRKLQVDGRPGWIKVVGEGWSEFYRSIEKEIVYAR